MIGFDYIRIKADMTLRVYALGKLLFANLRLQGLLCFALEGLKISVELQDLLAWLGILRLELGL
jgi:hypothetical protein